MSAHSRSREEEIELSDLDLPFSQSQLWGPAFVTFCDYIEDGSCVRQVSQKISMQVVEKYGVLIKSCLRKCLLTYTFSYVVPIPSNNRRLQVLLEHRK
jgi:hypothetical protein